MAVSLHFCMRKHTSLLTPEQRATLPESELYQLSVGIRLEEFLQQYVACCFRGLFHAQTCIHATTYLIHDNKFIFPVMGLVGATAVAMGLIIALTCLPLSLMWQIRPDPGGSNSLQDLKRELSLHNCHSYNRKYPSVIIYFLFSLGVFIRVAATIRVVLIFHMLLIMHQAYRTSVRLEV
ncbi:hypothetical protein CCUS01_10985 [Colletotrichum cuscutae]|uniref:Uncharacterized protein n=1 Tax=Colletotrichum cuscutae TaxID=1209917 RepID=A0AAI9XLM1_9PEZI|nr:hypothetical protein CCUS01_10985 [Colletotrichum cuscutae]